MNFKPLSKNILHNSVLLKISKNKGETQTNELKNKQIYLISKHFFSCASKLL